MIYKRDIKTGEVINSPKIGDVVRIKTTCLDIKYGPLNDRILTVKECDESFHSRYWSIKFFEITSPCNDSYLLRDNEIFPLEKENIQLGIL